MGSMSLQRRGIGPSGSNPYEGVPDLDTFANVEEMDRHG